LVKFSKITKYATKLLPIIHNKTIASRGEQEKHKSKISRSLYSRDMRDIRDKKENICD
jgi:hypothetical protein